MPHLGRGASEIRSWDPPHPTRHQHRNAVRLEWWTRDRMPRRPGAAADSRVRL